MTILYWFRRDRRLSDNPALCQAVAHSDDAGSTLLPVTAREPDQTTAWGFARLGAHRLAYEAQSLAGLQQALRRANSDLYQPDEPGMMGLVNLARANQVTDVFCEALYAPEELAEIQALQASGIRVHAFEQSALLPASELPFEIQRTPTVFSEFRRQAEKAKAQPRTPLASPTTSAHGMPALPGSIVGARPYQKLAPLPEPDSRSALPYQTPHWHGDEACGQAHVQRYFASTLPGTYKATRNGLIGTDYSTKFSPWLATGAISAAQIWQALQQHEATYGGNDGTYWIWFELLWRDHFALMMRRYANALFHYQGLAKTLPEPLARRQHNRQGFERWCAGQTGQPFIDAGMRELAHTGYLSNRMRQNVASYLIHDLGGDWRAGAAWFEHCLIDFDVHSNQGNWAYIAGVGTDPRGGRRFNPDKQAHDYDRDARYRELWSAS